MVLYPHCAINIPAPAAAGANNASGGIGRGASAARGPGAMGAAAQVTPRVSR